MDINPITAPLKPVIIWQAGDLGIFAGTSWVRFCASGESLLRLHGAETLARAALLFRSLLQRFEQGERTSLTLGDSGCCLLSLPAGSATGALLLRDTAGKMLDISPDVFTDLTCWLERQAGSRCQFAGFSSCWPGWWRLVADSESLCLTLDREGAERFLAILLEEVQSPVDGTLGRTRRLEVAGRGVITLWQQGPVHYELTAHGDWPPIVALLTRGELAELAMAIVLP